MKKKAFATILILALALTITLAACTGSETDVPPDNNSSTGDVSTPGADRETPTPDNSTPETPIEDFGYGYDAQPGELIEFGGLKWRVLEERDGSLLIISEYVIENMPYHNERADITWAESDIRAYLNGDFYNSFSADERAHIAEANIVNNDNPWFGAYGAEGGADTQDYLFLLSIEEVVRYFGDSGQLNNGHGDSHFYINDEYNDARVAYNTDGSPSWWWLRSPGMFSTHAAYVDPYGYLDINGETIDDISASSLFGGIRPALWLNP